MTTPYIAGAARGRAKTVSRRRFLKTSTAAAGAALLGLPLTAAGPARAAVGKSRQLLACDD